MPGRCAGRWGTSSPRFLGVLDILDPSVNQDHSTGNPVLKELEVFSARRLLDHLCVIPTTGHLAWVQRSGAAKMFPLENETTVPNHPASAKETYINGRRKGAGFIVSRQDIQHGICGADISIDLI